MRKILIAIFTLVLACNTAFAADGISFVYINGSNNNDLKMKNWYENGVKKLHPIMKSEFEKSTLATQFFLKNNKYFIQPNPVIFFWGNYSERDLSFVDNNIAILKGISPWVSYQVRLLVAHYLHDAIWVQKDHNMNGVLKNLHESVKKEIKSGNKVVLFGYSAGSFVTYEYLLTRLPFMDVMDSLSKVKISKEDYEIAKAHPMKNTCLNAFVGSKLAFLSSSGHIIINPYNFLENYMSLDTVTKDVCIPEDGVKGIVNFASPLVLFYSDIVDPNFELTYYNKLMYKYIIEKDLFWLTVNYREDPLGFPTTRNLTIEELAKYAQIEIEPHAGFIYDSSNTSSKRTFAQAHTAYWSTRRTFAKAVVAAYDNGYRHQYDKEFQKRALKKYVKIPLPIVPQIHDALQKLP